jgi:cytochrome c oxidase subunit 1
LSLCGPITCSRWAWQCSDLYFAAASFIVSILTGIKIFNWLATMYGGKIHFASPMLFAMGFLSMFVIGGLTGIMLACAPFDYQLSDTYFVVGHFHWVLIGGTLFGVFAGLHYWYPKVTGRMLSERLAWWQFWLLLLGFMLTFGPMHVAGMLGMPRRIYTYEPDRGWDIWNQLHGRARCCGASYVIFVYNVVVSLWQGKPAGDNPGMPGRWNGRPQRRRPYNFETIPTVHSRRPLWDLKHPDDPDWKYE